MTAPTAHLDNAADSIGAVCESGTYALVSSSNGTILSSKAIELPCEPYLAACAANRHSILLNVSFEPRTVRSSFKKSS